MNNQKPTYENLFGSESYYTVPPHRSVLSPGAYLTELLKLVDNNIVVSDVRTSLKDRRSDLYTLPLNKINTDNEFPKLDIVNKLLEERLGSSDLSRATYPFSMPYNKHLEEIRLYLKQNNTSLQEIWKMLIPEENRTYGSAASKSIDLETLGLSNEQWDQYTISQKTELFEYYGFGENSDFEEAFGWISGSISGGTAVNGSCKTSDFCNFTGLTQNELRELIYQDLNNTEISESKTPRANFYINKDNTAGEYIAINGENLENLSGENLDRIMRFVRLAQAIGWSFTDLDWALYTIRNTKPTPTHRDEALPFLAWIQTQVKDKGLSVNQCCAVLGQLKDFGKKYGLTFYESIFANPLNSQLPEPKSSNQYVHWDFSPTNSIPEATLKYNEEIENALSAALKVSAKELQTIAKIVYEDNSSLDYLPLKNRELSLLYRLSILPQLTGFKSIAEALIAINILDAWGSIDFLQSLQQKCNLTGVQLKITDPESGSKSISSTTIKSFQRSINSENSGSAHKDYCIKIDTTNSLPIIIKFKQENLSFKSLEIGSEVQTHITSDNINQIVTVKDASYNFIGGTQPHNVVYVLDKLEQLSSWLKSSHLNLYQLQFIVRGESSNASITNSILSSDAITNFKNNLREQTKKVHFSNSSVHQELTSNFEKILYASFSSKELATSLSIESNVLANYLPKVKEFSVKLTGDFFTLMKTEKLISNGIIADNNISSSATFKNLFTNILLKKLDLLAGKTVNDCFFNTLQHDNRLAQAFNEYRKNMIAAKNHYYDLQQKTFAKQITSLYHVKSSIGEVLIKWGDINIASLITESNEPENLLSIVLSSNNIEELVKTMQKLQQVAMLINKLSLSSTEATYFLLSNQETNTYPISFDTVQTIWLFKLLAKSFGDSQNNLLNIIKPPENSTKAPDLSSQESALTMLTDWIENDITYLIPHLPNADSNIQNIWQLQLYFNTSKLLGVKMHTLINLQGLADRPSSPINNYLAYSGSVFSSVTGESTATNWMIETNTDNSSQIALKNGNSYLTITTTSPSLSTLKTASYWELKSLSNGIKYLSQSLNGSKYYLQITSASITVTETKSPINILYEENGVILSSWTENHEIDTAQALWGCLQAQYKDQPTVLSKIQNKRDQKIRNELVPAVINFLKSTLTDYSANAQGLYEYLLIDVEVSAVVQTTYVREAISAAQLYINRVLNQLEPKACLKPGSQLKELWVWMQSYREWQANREVFLYPEDYIQPQLRVEKTDLFTKAEHALKQANLTNPDNVENIFREYMNGFEQISQIQIISCCSRKYTKEEATEQQFKELFFLGNSSPGHYYYRLSTLVASDSKSWEPYDWGEWKKIGTPIKPFKTKKMTYSVPQPIHAFGKWFLFWADDQVFSGEGIESGTSTTIKKTYSAKISYIYLDYCKNWTKEHSYKEILIGESQLSELSNNEIEVTSSSLSGTSDDIIFISFLKLSYSYHPSLDVLTHINWLSNTIEPQNGKELGTIICTTSCNNEIYISTNEKIYSSVFIDGKIQFKSIIQEGELEKIKAFEGGGYTFLHLQNAQKLYYTAPDGSWLAISFSNVITTLVSAVSIIEEKLVISTNDTGGSLFVNCDIGQISQYINNPQDVSMFFLMPSTSFNHFSEPINGVILGFTDHSFLMITQFSGIGEEVLVSELTHSTEKSAATKINGIFEVSGALFITTDSGLFYCQTTLHSTAKENWEQVPGTEGHHFKEITEIKGFYYACCETGIFYCQEQSANIWNSLGEKTLVSTKGISQDFNLAQSASNRIFELDGIIYFATANKTYFWNQNDEKWEEIKSNHTENLSVIGQVNTQLGQAYFAKTENNKISSFPYRISDLHSNNDVKKGEYYQIKNENEFLSVKTSELKLPSEDLFIVSENKSQYLNISYLDDTNINVFQLTTSTLPVLSNFLTSPSGVQSLLSLNAQLSSEYDFKNLLVTPTPPITRYPSKTIDFTINSAMQIYFWELFFHLPFLIAEELKIQQHFAQAKKWYEYIFNPTKTSLGTQDDDDIYQNDIYWCFQGLRSGIKNDTGNYINETLHKELVEGELTELRSDLNNTSQLNASYTDPFDPQVIAKFRPIAYQKTIVTHYIHNLITWGDFLYKQNTRDSIDEAEMLYVNAYNLLGERPVNLGFELLNSSTSFNIKDSIFKHSLDSKSIKKIDCHNGILYANTHDGLWISFDQNNTWSKAQNLPNKSIESIHFHNEVIYACMSGDGLWISFDNSTFSRAPQVPHIFSIRTVNYHKGVIYVLTNLDGLWISHDNGNKFVKSPNIPGTVDIHLTHYYGGILYALATEGGLWISFDNGDNFVKSLDIPQTSNITRITYYNGVLYTHSSDGLWISFDNGDSWSRAVNIPNASIKSISYCDGILYVSVLDNGLWFSSDNGQTFNVITDITDNTIINSIDYYNGVLFASAQTKGLWISFDNGSAWSQEVKIPSSGVYVNSIDCYNGVLYVCRDQSNLWISYDDGHTFNIAPNIPKTAVVSFVNYYHGVLYAHSSQGLWISFDNGITWSQEKNIPISSTFNSIDYYNESIYIGTIKGLYQSLPAFGIPRNKQFLSYWDEIQSRLFNIRHGLTLNGQLDELPLFSPPINPAQLVEAVGSGESMEEAVSSLSAVVPYYRFDVIIEKAKEVTASVIQLGQSLLSALEARDGQKLAKLYNTNQQNILNLSQTSKQDQLKSAEQNILALQSGLISAQNRQTHYRNLISQGLSSRENQQIDLANDAITAQLAVEEIRIAAIIGYCVPTIFGFSDGGFHPGDAINQGATIAEGIGSILNQKSGISGIQAGYGRRVQDWDLQEQLATDDIGQINYQVLSAQYQEDLVKQEIELLNKNIEQQQKVAQFYLSKFTNDQLYSWYIGQVSSLYYQGYDLAKELAMQAENAWKFENVGRKKDFSSFITSGNWSSLHEGLLAGESLQLDLQRMEKTYMDQNERKLEIKKTISLAQLDPMQLMTLKQTGSCQIDISEKDFAFDFPGHYCRQIKSVSVSIPMILGPYQNIHATLTQLTNKLISTDGATNGIPAAKYLLGAKHGSQTSSLVVDLLPNQQVALSQGINDTGLFEMNFNDPRYLPFEGTGAVSSWLLEMPQDENSINYESITDVIIELNYTALQGSDSYKTAVKDARGGFSGAQIISLAQAFPSAWHGFVDPTSIPLTFSVDTRKWRGVGNQNSININRITAYAQVSEKGNMASDCKLQLEYDDTNPETLTNWSNNVASISNLDLGPTKLKHKCSLSLTSSGSLPIDPITNVVSLTNLILIVDYTVKHQS